MKESHVINQHYIPQCLLKYFSNEKGQVSEALVESGKVYITNYRNAMSERYTYEHLDIQKNKVEKYFCEIESYIGTAVQTIISIIEDTERLTLPFETIQHEVSKYLKEFIVFYYRSGALLTEFEFERDKKSDRVLLMLEKILDSSYISELASTIADYYQCAVIKSENSELLLSDQYISTVALAIKNRFMNISNRHIGIEDLLILIPLSSRYYIAYFDGKIPSYINVSRVNSLTQEQIEEINSAILNNSYRKCIGYSIQALEIAMSSFEYQSPCATYSGGSGMQYGSTLKKEIFYYGSDREAWEFFVGHSWLEYKGLARNDRCLCGSNTKFKKCCMPKFDICSRMYFDIEHQQLDYKVHEDAIGEKAITEFYCKER